MSIQQAWRDAFLSAAAVLDVEKDLAAWYMLTLEQHLTWERLLVKNPADVAQQLFEDSNSVDSADPPR